MFTTDWDFQHAGASSASVPDRGAVFVMTEPPYTDSPLDEARGRILRVFRLDDGSPVPPDEGPSS